MENFGGLTSAIYQTNAVGNQDSSMNLAVQSVNNRLMDQFQKAKETAEAKLGETEQKAWSKLGEYGVAVSDKFKNYEDWVKKGGKVDELGSVQLGRKVGGMIFGRATNGVEDQERLNPDDEKTPGTQTYESSLEEELGISQESAEQPTSDQLQSQTQASPEEPPEEEAPAGESNQPSEATEGVEAGEEAAEETAGGLGKLAKGVMKTGGALFSAGMFANDVYDQVKDKEFFYGDNAGDKVGNFMNELGSGADLMGVATGDPLLVLGGVGLGAVGSIVSDISELVSGVKKNKDEQNKTPPPQIQAPASSNLAGTGMVAETIATPTATVS